MTNKATSNYLKNRGMARRVLVIDDTPAIHEDYRRILIPSRKEAEELENIDNDLFGDETRSYRQQQKPILDVHLEMALQGKDGYNKVKAAVDAGNPFQLAFVDMRMPPGWDGLQTMKKLWELDPELEVVLCTAFSDYQWTEIMDTITCPDRLLILKKPFEPIEVLQLTTALTDKWVLRQMAAEQSGMLLQAEKMDTLGQLASGLMHDVNNQLSGIIGFTELIRDHTSDPHKISHYSDRILQAAESAASISKQILSFARKETIQREASPIAEVVSGVSDLLQHSTSSAVEVSVTIAQGAEAVKVFIDKAQIENALLNLGVNARDAIEDVHQQGGVITFELDSVVLDRTFCDAITEDLEPGPYIKILVTDNGSGVPEAMREKIFEPFFTTKEKGKGTGLGLSSVVKVIQDHEGIVRCDANHDAGTCFSVYLPVAPSSFE